MISTEEIALILALFVGISMALSIGYVLGYAKGKQVVCENWHGIDEKPQGKYTSCTYSDDIEPIEFITRFVYSSKCGMEKEFIENWLKETTNE